MGSNLHPDFFAGWGAMDPDSAMRPKELQVVDVQVLILRISILAEKFSGQVLLLYFYE
jgi:hypothetical protein